MDNDRTLAAIENFCVADVNLLHVLHEVEAIVPYEESHEDTC
jgi:hypothetical protein